jgi:hypothetical protein
MYNTLVKASILTFLIFLINSYTMKVSYVNKDSAIFTFLREADKKYLH